MRFKGNEMHTDDESEIEYTVVKRVASVTIESDMQVEAEAKQHSGRIRRKKRMLKRKNANEKMDVDVTVSQLSSVNKGNIVESGAGEFFLFHFWLQFVELLEPARFQFWWYRFIRYLETTKVRLVV